MKKVLILGKNSYLGESLYSWLCRFSDEYSVQIVSTMDHEWQNADFSDVDALVDFAGIAHLNNITEDMRDLFYSVNRDLTVEIGRYAKEHGVKQLIVFSSMNVYGDFVKNLDSRENVNPTSFYGDSKLQGDLGVQELADDSFAVACIRPPFVYGKGCRGNYNSISKVVKKTFIFPTYKNKKSMIYVDNLCEFIRLTVNEGVGGVFTPQNRELKSTADLAREIAKATKKKVWFTCLFNWMIPLGKKLSKTVKKAFSDDYYDLSLSDYYNFDYCVVDFEESVRRTEEKG